MIYSKFADDRKRKFAILCVKQYERDPEWLRWADDWLNGKDRTFEAAEVLVYSQSISNGAHHAAIAVMMGDACAPNFEHHIDWAVSEAVQAVRGLDFKSIAKASIKGEK